MPYSTQANITAIYPLTLLAELTNGTGGAVNATTLAAAIEKADLQIDHYLEALYGPTPLSPVPNMVKWWSIDLTLYELAKLVGIGASPGFVTNGKNTLECLKQISLGGLSIPGLAPTRRVAKRSPDMVPLFSIGRKDASGGAVGTPVVGTLDRW